MQEETSDRFGEVEVVKVQDGKLYLLNRFDSSVEVDKVDYGGYDCNVLRNLSVGLNTVDIDDCYTSLGDGFNEVVVYSDRGVFSKNIFLMGK